MNDYTEPDLSITADDISLGGGVDIVQSASLVDDVEIESYNDDIAREGELSPENKLKQMRDKLAVCVKDKQANLDGWQRAKADFINYKKREDEGKAEFLKFAREELIIDLMPVLESFNLAFANKEAWEKVDPSWRTGVEYISSQFTQVLESHGLKKIFPLGEVFDPKVHTAVGELHTSDAIKLHKIAEVLQPGYSLSGKIVRSPHVKVYSTPEHATKKGDQ